MALSIVNAVDAFKSKPPALAVRAIASTPVPALETITCWAPPPAVARVSDCPLPVTVRLEEFVAEPVIAPEVAVKFNPEEPVTAAEWTFVKLAAAVPTNVFETLSTPAIEKVWVVFSKSILIFEPHASFTLS